MSTIAPPARYDLPWKEVVAHAFRPFMDFYFPDFSARFDWRQRPRFRDKELAGFGIGAKPDVTLADADRHWRPGSFRQRADGRTFAFTTAKLLDHVADVGALEASHDPIAWLTLAHCRTLQTQHESGKRYAAKLHLTRLLFKRRWKPRRIIVLFNAINWMMTLPIPLEQRFWQAILRLEKEHEMKLLNPLEQMFFDDGIKKGHA